jgi:hypothetical protein
MVAEVFARWRMDVMGLAGVLAGEGLGDGVELRMVGTEREAVTVFRPLSEEPSPPLGAISEVPPEGEARLTAFPAVGPSPSTAPLQP